MVWSDKVRQASRVSEHYVLVDAHRTYPTQSHPVLSIAQDSD